jgi:hypothetical protein
MDIQVGDTLHCQLYNTAAKTWQPVSMPVTVIALRRSHAGELESVRVRTISGPRHTCWTQPRYLSVEPYRAGKNAR